MRNATLLIALSAVSVFACGKTEDAPAPASETPVAEAPLTATPSAPTSTTESPAPPLIADPVVPSASEPAPEAAAPAAPAAAPATPKSAPAPAADASQTPPTAPTPAAAPADLAKGQQIYRQACAFCHDKGAAGAPKLGDKAAWAPRIAQGMDALYTASLRGKGAMPAKGGNPALADADVKAAVDYLVAQSR